MPNVALALDLGGTKVASALVNDSGHLLPGTRFQSPTGASSSTAELGESIRSVVTRTLATVPSDARMLGAGIGSAGPVNAADGLVSPLNLPAWRDYPLAALVQQLVPGLPVRLRLDGLCITLAEHWVGAGAGYDNVMGMVVSTGIGGGLILGGHTIAGPTGNAGHIGHIEVAGFDDPCACGGRGCIEAVASGPNTVRHARSLGWEGETGEQLAQSYRDGDRAALAAVMRSGHAIGQAIASAASLLDLDLVAVGGGFSHVSPDLLAEARSAIADRVQFGFVTRVRVVPSALSGDGPLIGAAALVHRPEVVD